MLKMLLNAMKYASIYFQTGVTAYGVTVLTADQAGTHSYLRAPDQ